MQGEVISELALNYLHDFATSPVPHAVYVREDETKDTAMEFRSYYEANLAWDELLSLGLITDTKVSPWVNALAQKTGRQFRMFHLTEYGRVMDNLDLYIIDEENERLTWRPKNLH